MPSPAVSVVIPCFNLGRFVDEAVDSVLAQTFSDYEILVVDDGSTDVETRERLARYHKPATRVLRTSNHGLPAAKNAGIADTTGQYICALDADDRLEPDMLEKSVAALEQDPGLAFVSHWLRYFGDATGEWTPDRCDFPALLDMNTVNGAALVRRAAVQAVGGYDESFKSGCEDWDFWITLVERGFKGMILPEVLFNYRRRPASMSRTMLEREGHPALYARLVRKHDVSYRQHLDTLILRRERGIVNLRRHNHDLAMEYDQRLHPQLAQLRDDVACWERKVSRSWPGQERAGMAARLEAAEREAHALRESMSWKVTAPLRAVYGTLRRLRQLLPS
jgi:glycosyltransferase involved in cell wall biosynthesis